MYIAAAAAFVPSRSRLHRRRQRQQPGQSQQQPYDSSKQPPICAHLFFALLRTVLLRIMTMELEEIFPGICLTLSEHVWTADKIRAHGFTHIIRIDRRLAGGMPAECLNGGGHLGGHLLDQNANFVRSGDADHLYAGFKTLDLQFGEDAFLSAVLPNCYKAVGFIETALRGGGGTVLVVDRASKQKCVTVVIGYLMYKHHIKFSSAFQRVKQLHPGLELHHFYQSQLREYEPILQVQRSQSFGNSCSRELRSAHAKRKLSSMHDEERCFDEDSPPPAPLAASPGPASPASSTSSSSYVSSSSSTAFGVIASVMSASSSSASSSLTSNSSASSYLFNGGFAHFPFVRDSTCPADILME